MNPVKAEASCLSPVVVLLLKLSLSRWNILTSSEWTHREESRNGKQTHEQNPNYSEYFYFKFSGEIWNQILMHLTSRIVPGTMGGRRAGRLGIWCVTKKNFNISKVFVVKKSISNPAPMASLLWLAASQHMWWQMLDITSAGNMKSQQGKGIRLEDLLSTLRHCMVLHRIILRSQLHLPGCFENTLVQWEMTSQIFHVVPVSLLQKRRVPQTLKKCYNLLYHHISVTHLEQIFISYWCF